MQLQKKTKKYCNVETSYWGNLVPIIPNNIEKYIVQKSWYREITKTRFEFIDINIPVGYLEYLKHVYGDWETMIMGDTQHGDCIINPYIPYTDYLTKAKK